VRSLFLFPTLAALSLFAGMPAPPGRLVDIGGYRLHLTCVGKGSPTVVIGPGIEEFYFHWTQVQSKANEFTRVCTYDRAGYAWSDPGPKPRSYAQLNLELHELLRKAGEKGPFVLVGHSFGGPVVREYAKTYPKQVAGMVLVDVVHEDQRVVIGGKAVQLREYAKGISIPAPKLKPAEPVTGEPEREGRTWASRLPALQDAENDQRTWSPEGLLYMHEHPDLYQLRDIPLLVLMRAKGGYRDGLGLPPEELERQRREQQAALAKLSSRGRLQEVAAGHDMQLEAPDLVAAAIREVAMKAKR